MTIYQQDFLICPWCDQQSGQRVDHLYSDALPRAFGSWECKECGRSFRGTVTAPGTVTLERDEAAKVYGRALALLRFNGKDGPVYFVMDRRYHTPGEPDEEFQSHESYFFEEHSCPTNWLRDCVTVIENGDMDPHGFLDHVRSVEVPRDFDEDDDDKVRDLFPECFPETIDHRVSLPPASK